MMSRLPLSVGPQAEPETQRSAHWYNNESPGLGEAFLEVVHQTLNAVSENPYQFPRVHPIVGTRLLGAIRYIVFRDASKLLLDSRLPCSRWRSISP